MNRLQAFLLTEEMHASIATGAHAQELLLKVGVCQLSLLGLL